MMHLLLADDHALVREGLKQLFALTTDIRVAAEATNGAQVIEAIRSQRFDVVLLDLTMPGISGPDLITRLRGQEGAPPILVLSMHNEPQIARRALAAGASGYLTKDSNPEVLLGAVRRVAAGGRFLDPVLAEAMAFEQPLASRDRPPHESLSDRELQVFNLLARGMGVNDIAQQLAISNKTVSTHKARLMEKLNLATTTDIVRYAISYGLME
jgi:DNA-binding NarL/FixJ family response regulator